MECACCSSKPSLNGMKGEPHQNATVGTDTLRLQHLQHRHGFLRVGPARWGLAGWFDLFIFLMHGNSLNASHVHSASVILCQSPRRDVAGHIRRHPVLQASLPPACRAVPWLLAACCSSINIACNSKHAAGSQSQAKMQALPVLSGFPKQKGSRPLPPLVPDHDGMGLAGQLVAHQ